MKLKVKYAAQLRVALQRAEEVVECPEAETLADFIAHLASRGDAGRPHLVNDAGAVRASLLVVVNETAVSASDAPRVILQDGDTIWFLPPIAGG